MHRLSLRAARRTLRPIAVLLALLPLAAGAECRIEATGDIRILANDFASLELVTGRAQDCAREALTVSVEHTVDHKALQGPALSADPAAFDIVMIANNSLPPLLMPDLVRPLDSLIAQYGRQLTRSQLIRIDGQVMAIAFMVNGMHLFSRADILERAGVADIPKSWEEVLRASEKIRAAGIMDYPLVGTFAPGWELAQVFVNMFTAAGGEFFATGSADPLINGEAGRDALEMLKALTEYMPPDFLTIDALEAARRWKMGDVALMNLWSSQAGELIDRQAGDARIARTTVLSAAPTLGDRGIPGGALFWDGFVIASHISDEDAETAFRVMMHAIDPALAAEHPTGASWVIRGYVPAANALGIMANVGEGAVNYPTSPYMERMHAALGTELVGYLRGLKSAEQTLDDIERAYIKSAGTAGRLD